MEQYGYCAHNWWLARHGSDPQTAASRQGTAAHSNLGTMQVKVEDEKREYRRASAWFWRVVMFACSALILTLEVVYLRSFQHIVILVAATGILVAGGAAMLLLGIINERRYKQGQQKAGLVPGKLVASDLGGRGELLWDPLWRLSGRPDYVLEAKEGFVPVEVKAGKTPNHPHHNHRLQVGCYLRLIETKTGQAPPYGLLNYPDGVFRVAWDDKLKGDVQEVIAKIEQARVAGRADRDHEHKARCIGCARRDACEQKLA